MPYTGFTGELPLGDSGLSGNKNVSKLLPTELLTATNVDYFGNIMQKEGGARRYNTNAVPGGGTILGGFDWHPTEVRQRQILFTSAGYILKESGGTGTFNTTLATGLNTDHAMTFCEGGQEFALSDKKLFFFNGYDTPKVLAADGTTADAIEQPAADWTGTNQPTCGVVHDKRLYVAMGHRLYWSNPEDHEDFSENNSQLLFPGIGTRILFMMSFKGLLLVFKEGRGVFTFDTTNYDYTPNTFPQVMTLNNTIGIKSPHAVIQIDDDILFMDALGDIRLVSGIQNYDLTTKRISNIHYINMFIKDNVYIRNIDQVKVVHYWYKNEIHFAVPQKNHNREINTARLVLDMNKQEPRWRWSPLGIACQSMWLRKDINGIHRLLIGDNQGFIFQLDQDTRSILVPADYTKIGVDTIIGEFALGFNGIAASAYDTHFTTETDFGYLNPELASRMKLWSELELVGESRTGRTLYVDQYNDGVFRHTLTFPLDPVGVPLGVFVLGRDHLGSTHDLAVTKRKLLGSGRRLKLVWRNAEVDGDFAIGRAFIRFRASDERITNTQ